MPRHAPPSPRRGFHAHPSPLSELSPTFASQGERVNKYQYNGIELINDFGLHANHALYRTLDPQRGQWWQIDPLSELHYKFNPYNFTLDNPTRYRDPFGLDTLPTVEIKAKRIEKTSEEEVQEEPEQVEESLLDQGERVYNGTGDALSLAFIGLEQIPSKVIHHYTYETSKKINKYAKSNNYKKRIKPGTLNRFIKGNIKKGSKVLGKVGTLGLGFSTLNIMREYHAGEVDAHTYVDGALVLLGVAALTGLVTLNPVAIVGLAVYGTADLLFDLDPVIDDFSHKIGLTNDPKK